MPFWRRSVGRRVSRGLIGALFRYGESEVDPVIHAEILLESARAEARVAVLEILLAIGFGLWFNFSGPEFRAVALFALITVAPLLVDSAIRRRFSERLRGIGPQPR